MKIPYMVCVDEFQHKVFENPEMTAIERRSSLEQPGKDLYAVERL